MSDASSLAERLLASLERRLTHVRAVAARAEQLTACVPDDQRESLVIAAWLHDIGYAPSLRVTGLHALDGARYLRSAGWPEIVVGAVAQHSAARYEAEERGLSEELAEFPFRVSALQDALDTADLTTGPDGQALSFTERMSEILDRYPVGDPVHRFWLNARDVEAAAIERTLDRLMAPHPR